MPLFSSAILNSFSAASLPFWHQMFQYQTLSPQSTFHPVAGATFQIPKLMCHSPARNLAVAPHGAWVNLKHVTWQIRLFTVYHASPSSIISQHAPCHAYPSVGLNSQQFPKGTVLSPASCLGLFSYHHAWISAKAAPPSWNVISGVTLLEKLC